MPFSNIFRRNDQKHIPEMSNKEKKSMLSLKAVQAQQNPAPFYDLSGCDAPSIPDDTYTFCKLLGKTSLLVNRNCLTGLDSGGCTKDLSHLEHLDVSCNKIERFSMSIYFLTNLKILNISGNKLKTFPDGFYQLSSLEELYVCKNKLSTVPASVCALPQLKILQIQENYVSKLPNDLCKLQNSLVEFKCDTEKIKYPPDICSMDLVAILTFLCKACGTDYTGMTVAKLVKEDNSKTLLNYSTDIDGIMADYLQKKEEQAKRQYKAEEELRNKERLQVEDVLESLRLSKIKLLSDVTDGTPDLDQYDSMKQERIKEMMTLEEEFKLDQEKQLKQYMNNTCNKDTLLGTIICQEAALQEEVTAIVAQKDSDRAKLFKDLTNAEKEIDCSLQEIVNGIQVAKSAELALLVHQQDVEMQKLLIQYEKNTNNLCKEDVIKVMKDSMIKELENVALYHMMDDKKKAFALSVIHQEGVEEEYNLKTLLDIKEKVKVNLLSDLEENEKHQEAAFKLLLLKMDLKRNNILRQIGLIEYELTRLSSLELRKKHCDFQYGSNTMLNQRTTLANLLGSLIKARDDREKELYDWCLELEDQRCQKKESEDYWLHQYQRLMTLKPPSLAKAEDQVDEEILKILRNAYAMDILPVFARHDISFSKLLEMTEEDFSDIGIGHATYLAIQRSIMKHLNEQKLGTAENDGLPSAPEIHEEGSFAPTADTLPVILDEASAPPIEQTFQEFECVVCLSNPSCIVFLNCGHVCTCSDCCITLSSCPLCRADIVSRYYVVTK